MRALLPSPLQMFVLLRQPAKNLILMGLCEQCSTSAPGKQNPALIPNGVLGEKPKPWTPCTISGVFLCLAAFIGIVFPQKSPCSRAGHPGEPQWCHICAAHRACPWSSGEQFCCKSLLPNAFPFSGKAAADAFVDSNIRRLFPNVSVLPQQKCQWGSALGSEALWGFFWGHRVWVIGRTRNCKLITKVQLKKNPKNQQPRGIRLHIPKHYFICSTWAGEILRISCASVLK